MRILTRQPSPRMEYAELTHMARARIDADMARRQHDLYCAALAQAGAEVEVLPPLAGYPDCAFVEDLVVSLPEVTILCRPGVASRQGEVAHIVASLPADRDVVALDGAATLEGGDVLRIGRTLYVGMSGRSNPDGIAALRQGVARFGYEVVPVPVRGALHLKTAVTQLPDGRLLLNPDWVAAGGLGGRAFVRVDPDEAFGANSLTVGTALFYPAVHRKTAARLRAEGLAPVLLDISEFAKAEAGLTCMSVVFA